MGATTGLRFAHFLLTKSLDYSGGEVRVARPATWESIEPSLPPETGSLDIREFCQGGVFNFVCNIDDTILPVEEQQISSTPSIIVN